jgi:hypothetical protein
MTKTFSQIPKKPLTRSTISRYNLHVDNYATAPMRRLFHFVNLSSPTDTAVSLFTCNDLHTLDFVQTEQLSRFQQLPHSLKKHRDVPLFFPFRNATGHTVPGRTVAAVASQIAGLSSASWRDRSLHSARAAEMAIPPRHRPPSRSLSVLTCNKKAISLTLAGNALASNAVYKVIPIKRTDLQETDR